MHPCFVEKKGMQIRIIQPTSFLYFTAETNLRQLSSFLPVGEQLYREAVECKMRVCGAIQWHYYDFRGSDKPFRLDIALPVQSFPDGYDGIFHLKRSEPFRCVVEVHPGAWADLPDTYQRVMEYAENNALTPNHINREIYVAYDVFNPVANITWVQVGVS